MVRSKRRHTASSKMPPSRLLLLDSGIGFRSEEDFHGARICGLQQSETLVLAVLVIKCRGI